MGASSRPNIYYSPEGDFFFFIKRCYGVAPVSKLMWAMTQGREQGPRSRCRSGFMENKLTFYVRVEYGKLWLKDNICQIFVDWEKFKIGFIHAGLFPDWWS
ncbi:hypothetical protein BABINDRAFT_122933 [Babjeviella inositovora NRRL Y-12698]|uniref:Uncharacterized protein n=1 Tax=Babjeviella inositovora NRRL Y-12698 TaxID=984486 RepID=A0A1E3QUG5_9ASCO|nr:uncharacterized protein BABINDRAFT_122933 [Babjeviella inositovora NRRL Y-12698]ODQ81323.1 hypothetical protein BABINDRAFT_122933 [Babjeviella inositovora NRRL Y-12698]